MDFTSSEAQRDLSGLAGRILGDWTQRHQHRPLGGFATDLWHDMATAGLLDAALPASVGGGGFGLAEQYGVLTEIGRTAAPVPYLSSVVAAASAIAEFGTGTQVERWVLPIVRGAACVGLAIADEGSAPGFTGERTGSGWRVSGAQTAVLDGAAASAYLCEIDTSDGEVLLIVDRDADGVSVTPQETVAGAGDALVELNDVTVTDDSVLSAQATPEGGLTQWVRHRATGGLCAFQLGVLERALEMTSEYARHREQFGNPIGSFQAVRQRLAQAYIDVEAVRLTLWQAVWRMSHGLAAGDEVATAKFWAAEAGHRVAHTAVHVHGGVGIDTDYPLHRYFVAAERAEFALGGATAQLRALGSHLAAAPA